MADKNERRLIVKKIICVLLLAFWVNAAIAQEPWPSKVCSLPVNGDISYQIYKIGWLDKNGRRQSPIVVNRMKYSNEYTDTYRIQWIPDTPVQIYCLIDGFGAIVSDTTYIEIIVPPE